MKRKLKKKSKKKKVKNTRRKTSKSAKKKITKDQEDVESILKRVREEIAPWPQALITMASILQDKETGVNV